MAKKSIICIEWTEKHRRDFVVPASLAKNLTPFDSDVDKIIDGAIGEEGPDNDYEPYDREVTDVFVRYEA